MKTLRSLLFLFSLSAAGLILSAYCWIYDDYYKGAHPGHSTPSPHIFPWFIPFCFVVSALVALITYVALFNVRYNWREPSFLLAGMGLFALAIAPFTWMSHDYSSDPSALAVSHSEWLTFVAAVTGLSFAFFCYRCLSRGRQET